MSPATLEAAVVILTYAVLGLARGEEVSKWIRQLEAVLREMRSKEDRP